MSVCFPRSRRSPSNKWYGGSLFFFVRQKVFAGWLCVCVCLYLPWYFEQYSVGGCFNHCTFVESNSSIFSAARGIQIKMFD